MPNFIVTEGQARDACRLLGLDPDASVHDIGTDTQYDTLWFAPRWTVMQRALQAVHDAKLAPAR